MKTTFALIAMLFLMSACAPKMWIKDGATKEQFYQEKTDCQKIAGAIAGDNVLILNAAFNDCMKERGYRYESQ